MQTATAFAIPLTSLPAAPMPIATLWPDGEADPSIRARNGQ